MKKLCLFLSVGFVALALPARSQTSGPGYQPTAGADLTLAIGAGTSLCDDALQNYAGGTLSMMPSTTNYVYLDPSANCAPNSNITGFTMGTIPIATVLTGASAITSVTDQRSILTAGGAPGGTANAVQFDKGSSFGGDATNFSYDPAGHNLTVSGAVTANSFSANSFSTTGGTAGCLKLNSTSQRGGNYLYNQICANSSLRANTTWTWPQADGTSGQLLTTNGAGVLSWANGGNGGTMTSVGLSMPAQFVVSGSPVTTSGTLAATWANQNANTVLAGPANGAPAPPALRSLVATDLAPSPASGNCLTYNGAATAWGSCGATATIFQYGQRSGVGWTITAKTARATGFWLSHPVQFSKIGISVITADTTSGDYYDVGIYNSSGALVADIGPQSLGATGFKTFAIKQASPLALVPGKYYFALTGSAATARIDGASSVAPTFFCNGVIASSTSGGQLPSSVAVPADSWSDISCSLEFSLF